MRKIQHTPCNVRPPIVDSNLNGFPICLLYTSRQDISNAVTLPDPEVRMAALGVLGRLRRPASLSILSQAVYDPHPAVRAFAAGALGEFGSTDGIAPLTHALSDENPRVRKMCIRDRSLVNKSRNSTRRSS